MSNKFMAGFSEAELYYDLQDSSNPGWWLRYRDGDGTEQGFGIDAPEDAGVEQLASLLADESHWISGDGKIAVLRPNSDRRGSIAVSDGKVVSWSAL